MKKTFAFNQERNLKPGYGNQNITPVVQVNQYKPNAAELSRKEAKDWNDNYWPALRHVKLFKRLGREKWLKHYSNKYFINFIGVDSWQKLKRNMKEIMDSEK